MITLEQAQAGRQNHIDQQVIQTFRRNSLLLEQMVFDDAMAPNDAGGTLTYSYLRTETPGIAQFRELNHEYTPQEETRKQYSVDIKVLGGSFEVDRVLEDISGYYSELARQMEQKIKATCSLFQKTVIDGDSAEDGNSFDGLDKALTGSSTEFNAGSYIDLSSADKMDKNYKYLLDMMDELLASLCGRPSCILTNTSMLTKMKQVARRAGYFTRSEDAFGRSVDGFDGAPFMDMGYYAKKGESGLYTEQPVIPITTRKINGQDISGLTDIYVPVISLDTFHGVTVKGDKFISQYMPDMEAPGAAKKGEVEMLAAVALKNSRGAAVLRNVKIK